MKQAEITIPDGKLAIDINYGFRLLSKFTSELQFIQSGIPYSELGYGERRAASKTKIVEIQNTKKPFIKDKIAIVDISGLIRSDDTMYSYGMKTKAAELLSIKNDVI